MIDIEQARKRAQEAIERSEKATPGPWRQTGQYQMQREPVAALTNKRENETPEFVYSDTTWLSDTSSDARFIAEARTDVPQLAQDLLQALKDLEHWKANHDEMKARNDFLRSRPDMHYKDVHEHNHRLAVLDQLDAALDEIERLKETISDPPRRSL